MNKYVKAIKETGSKSKLARAAAEVFRIHGDNYPEDGPVELPDNVIDEIAKDLILAGIPLGAVQDLDSRPYEFLPYTLASHIHWISRRFRNSGGWQKLYPEGN
jgi:hypothetical protein